MSNTISPYFTDEDVCSQLRLQYSMEEMWRIDFKALLSQITDIGDVYQLKIQGRTFNIDKITGGITEVKL